MRVLHAGTRGRGCGMQTTGDSRGCGRVMRAACMLAAVALAVSAAWAAVLFASAVPGVVATLATYRVPNAVPGSLGYLLPALLVLALAFATAASLCRGVFGASRGTLTRRRLTGILALTALAALGFTAGWVASAMAGTWPADGLLLGLSLLFTALGGSLPICSVLALSALALAVVARALAPRVGLPAAVPSSAPTRSKVPLAVAACLAAVLLAVGAIAGGVVPGVHLPAFPSQTSGGGAGNGDAPTPTKAASQASGDGSRNEREDPSFLVLDGGYTADPISDAKSARESLAPLAAALGVTDVDSELADVRETGLGNTSTYRFSQSYQGIPVYGRSISVLASAGRARGLTGNTRDVSSVDTKPSVSQDDARAAAADTADGSATLTSEGLVIYSLGDDDPVLAYRFCADDGADAELIFVDAHAGKVVAQVPVSYSEQIEGRTNSGKKVSLNADRVDGTEPAEYRFVDEDAGISMYDAARKVVAVVPAAGRDEDGHTYDLRIEYDKDGNVSAFHFLGSSGADLIDVGNGDGTYALYAHEGDDEPVVTRAWIDRVRVESSGAELDPYTAPERDYRSSKAGKATATLYQAITQTHGFYQSVLGRDGFDGEGGKVIGVVNAKLDDSGSKNANAYNMGPHITRIIYGYGMGITLDVVAHELGHSLEGSLAGMVYTGETGAIMEGVSDVWGELVEDYANDGEMDGDCNWKVGSERNLAKPSKSKNPDTYRGKYWVDPYGKKSGEQDHGGVHTNASVISHALYLMVAGKDLPGDDLSTDQLARLLYIVLSMAPENCTMAQFRAVMERSALVLTDLSVNQVWRVGAAFDAVGIEAPDPTVAVARKARLEVYDVNGRLYGDYGVSAFALPTAASASDDASADVKAGERGTSELSFSRDGLYTLQVSDKAAGSSKTAGTRLLVVDGGLPAVSLSTDFGSALGAEELSRAEERDPTPRSAALVLDVSGSMVGDKADQLKAAAERFAKTVDTGGVDVGLVTYADDAEATAKLGSDEAALKRGIATGLDRIADDGNTDIEAGLSAAARMLAGNPGRKTIVLMSDGAANRGATGNALVAYAERLRSEGYRIFTVGFQLNGAAESLMSAMASDGRHYVADEGDTLQGFFRDIAEELSGMRYMLVRAACPVDVRVTSGGQTLSSAEADRNLSTSFGTLSLEEDPDNSDNGTVKTLRLKEGAAYDIRIIGTGAGTMDYTVGFANGLGDYTDYRSFDGIKVAAGTRVRSTAQVADETRVAIDEDGDGVFERALSATANGSGESVDSRLPVLATFGGTGALTVCAAALAVRRRLRRRTRAAAQGGSPIS